MILELNHMSFTVSDLARSVAFYRDVLGLELASLAERDPEFSARVTGIPGAHLRLAYLRAPNASVIARWPGAPGELIQYLQPPGARIDTRTCNVGSAHVCFIVNDFPALMERLRMAKVVFAGEVATVPAGPNIGRGVVYCEDPDGNTVEFLSDVPLPNGGTAATGGA